MPVAQGCCTHSSDWGVSHSGDLFVKEVRGGCTCECVCHVFHVQTLVRLPTVKQYSMLLLL